MPIIMSYIQSVCLSINGCRYAHNIAQLKCMNISEWVCASFSQGLDLPENTITLLHLFILSSFSHTLSFTESQCFAGNSSGSGSTPGSSGLPVLLTSTGKCIHQLISQMIFVRIVPQQPISSSRNQTQATGTKLVRRCLDSFQCLKRGTFRSSESEGKNRQILVSACWESNRELHYIFI